MIATGGRATTLPVDGADSTSLYPADNRRCRSHSRKDERGRHRSGHRRRMDRTGSRGGGTWGATAIVVELADRVCARALTDMSWWIHDLHVRNGVDISRRLLRLFRRKRPSRTRRDGGRLDDRLRHRGGWHRADAECRTGTGSGIGKDNELSTSGVRRPPRYLCGW